MEPLTTVLVVLAGINLAIVLYLIWVFSVLRSEVRDGDSADEGGQEELRALLSEIGSELEGVARDVAAAVEENQDRLEDLSERVRALEAREASPESLEDADDDGDRAESVDEDEPEAEGRTTSRAGAAFKERHAKVEQLHDEGKSIREIAASLGMSQGEVELVLGVGKRVAGGEDDASAET